jgi:hypothetical protein
VASRLRHGLPAAFDKLRLSGVGIGHSQHPLMLSLSKHPCNAGANIFRQAQDERGGR